ncbi:MAG: hypothetical protein HY547_06950, partial [Elusimicrobia bacterium]|nr:hypothetical protein [Elusimicrobiota bacterium]
ARALGLNEVTPEVLKANFSRAQEIAEQEAIAKSGLNTQARAATSLQTTTLKARTYLQRTYLRVQAVTARVTTAIRATLSPLLSWPTPLLSWQAKGAAISSKNAPSMRLPWSLWNLAMTKKKDETAPPDNVIGLYDHRTEQTRTEKEQTQNAPLTLPSPPRGEGLEGQGRGGTEKGRGIEEEGKGIYREEGQGIGREKARGEDKKEEGQGRRNGKAGGTIRKAAAAAAAAVVLGLLPSLAQAGTVASVGQAGTSWVALALIFGGVLGGNAGLSKVASEGIESPLHASEERPQDKVSSGDLSPSLINGEIQKLLESGGVLWNLGGSKAITEVYDTGHNLPLILEYLENSRQAGKFVNQNIGWFTYKSEYTGRAFAYFYHRGALVNLKENAKAMQLLKPFGFEPEDSIDDLIAKFQSFINKPYIPYGQRSAGEVYRAHLIFGIFMGYPPGQVEAHALLAKIEKEGKSPPKGLISRNMKRIGAGGRGAYVYERFDALGYKTYNASDRKFERRLRMKNDAIVRKYDRLKAMNLSPWRIINEWDFDSGDLNSRSWFRFHSAAAVLFMGIFIQPSISLASVGQQEIDLSGSPLVFIGASLLALTWKWTALERVIKWLFRRRGPAKSVSSKLSGEFRYREERSDKIYQAIVPTLETGDLIHGTSLAILELIIRDGRMKEGGADDGYPPGIWFEEITPSRLAAKNSPALEPLLAIRYAESTARITDSSPVILRARSTPASPLRFEGVPATTMLSQGEVRIENLEVFSPDNLSWMPLEIWGKKNNLKNKNVELSLDTLRKGPRGTVSSGDLTPLITPWRAWSFESVSQERLMYEATGKEIPWSLKMRIFAEWLILTPLAAIFCLIPGIGGTIVHEYGHYAAALFAGAPVRNFSMTLLDPLRGARGGVTYLPVNNPLVNFIVTIAGPMFGIGSSLILIATSVMTLASRHASMGPLALLVIFYLAICGIINFNFNVLGSTNDYLSARSNWRHWRSQTQSRSDSWRQVLMDPRDQRPRPTVEDRPPVVGQNPPLKELKQVLGDGALTPGGWIEPFGFRLKDGSRRQARSAGLEGFLYTKLEIERDPTGIAPEQFDDFFRYLTALLEPFEWAKGYRIRLQKVWSSWKEFNEKNDLLNRELAAIISELQKELIASDPSQWVRQANTYMILARAYNRLRPGKNFFDSLDNEELRRIKDNAKADAIWLLDIFEIGDINRWGTGGGSPYAIKGYRVKKELGGEAGLKAFIERAHKLGLKIGVDQIPNHVSLDSDLIKNRPEALIHIVPPQELSDEQILAAVPKESAPKNPKPVFYLLKTNNYPEGGRRVEKRILVHHPITNFGGPGEDMWVDMAQRDLTSPLAREWEITDAKRLFGGWGVDFVRRDMSYDLLNERYLQRWLAILSQERDHSEGWMRHEMDQLIVGLERRAAQMGQTEILEEMTNAVRKIRPDGAVLDEAYSELDALSRTGSSAIYNKCDHDPAKGQIGLYDALVSRDPKRIREALKHAAFRRWQRGAAAALNFIGNHDGGEGNPVDKFGRYFKAAALAVLLLPPILLYNGVELGVGQKEMVIGSLNSSRDRKKALPFDIPIKINWTHRNDDNKKFIELVLAQSRRYRNLLNRGIMEVLRPDSQDSPIVAWSVSRVYSPVTLLMAANFTNHRGSGAFGMRSPIFEFLGAFKPESGKNYLFRDLANTIDGAPVTYRRSGQELLDQGLYIELDTGGIHFFEITEDVSGVLLGGQHFATLAISPRLPTFIVDFFKASWDKWTDGLTKLSLLAFAPLQLPQIWKNLQNLVSGNEQALSILPWMGYSTGILGNMLLLSFFSSQGEKSAALVQAVGVITSAFVVIQIFQAGFMPEIAFWLILPVIAAGLVINLLKIKNRLPQTIWNIWSRGSALVGLAALPQVFWSTFAPGQGTSLWPASAAFIMGSIMVVLDHRDWLPKQLKNLWIMLSAWTATMLFMFGPIAQLWNNYNNPENMEGISWVTLALAVGGNMLMLPRAILTKNLVWFTGSGWAVAVGGWAVLLSMFLYGVLSGTIFWGATIFIPLWIATAVLLARQFPISNAR